MRTRILMVTALAVLSMAGPARAGVLNGGHVMCLPEKALDKAFRTIQVGRDDLLKDIGCFSTDGVSGGGVDRGFPISMVRVTVPDRGAALVHVYSEAVRR